LVSIISTEDFVNDEAFPKLVDLSRRLRGRSAVVSFSGGVDSTFLALVARSFCARSLAVTAASPTLAPGELEEAKRLASLIGIEHVVVAYDELQEEEFARNPLDRCYHCKRGLLRELARLAEKEGYELVLEGTNASDMHGHRPGRRAVKEMEEMGVMSPLLEAGLSKDEIRRLSRLLGLPTWNKPSMACLASRIPYGTRITPWKLERVGAAEDLLRRMGFTTVRVRDHRDVARIEVEPAKIRELIQPKVSAKVVSDLRSLGFTHVTVDLLGYRTGSMNEAISDSSADDLMISAGREATSP